MHEIQQNIHREDFSLDVPIRNALRRIIEIRLNVNLLIR